MAELLKVNAISTRAVVLGIPYPEMQVSRWRLGRSDKEQFDQPVFSRCITLMVSVFLPSAVHEHSQMARLG